MGELGMHRYFEAGFAIFQCCIGAGIIFGWTSILPVLETEGLYRDVCPPEVDVCEAQTKHLQYAYTIGVTASLTSNLGLGLAFDRFGPRVTKAISLVLLIIGTILVGTADSKSSTLQVEDGLVWGMGLIGFSGPGVQLTNIHVANLFPEARALVTVLIVGALQFSFFIFTIFQYAYDDLNVSRSSIFSTYAAFLGVILVGCLVLDPDAPYPDPEAPPSSREPLSRVRLPSSFHEDDYPFDISTPELDKHLWDKSSQRLLGGRKRSLKRRSFKTQVTSIPYLLLTAYFAIGALWCNFFLGSLTPQLRAKGLEAASVDKLLSDLAIILPGSAVFIPLVGYLLEVCGYPTVTALSSLTAVTFAVLFSCFQSPAVLVAAFIVYTLFRTILFSLLFSLLGEIFGFRNFGVLSGITFAVAGLVSLLQTPLSSLHSWDTVNCLEIGTLVLTFALPLYLKKYPQHIE